MLPVSIMGDGSTRRLVSNAHNGGGFFIGRGSRSVVNIEQTSRAGCFVLLAASSQRKRACPMSSSQRKKCEDVHIIIALVELDLQKMWVRIVLARKAIRERMRELEHPTDQRRNSG
jgi:hypothetical protein